MKMCLFSRLVFPLTKFTLEQVRRIIAVDNDFRTKHRAKRHVDL